MSTQALSIPTGPVTGSLTSFASHHSFGLRHGPAMFKLYLWTLLPTVFSLVHGTGPQIALPLRPRRGEAGAVSLEQVLWFVAAGLSVAVVAGILWTQIRNQATTPINVPSAP